LFSLILFYNIILDKVREAEGGEVIECELRRGNGRNGEGSGFKLWNNKDNKV
jgi:hypothetical protein